MSKDVRHTKLQFDKEILRFKLLEIVIDKGKHLTLKIKLQNLKL